MNRLRRIGDSYRARLVLGYVLVAAVFAVAWGLSLYGPLTHAAQRQQERDLAAVARAGAAFASETTLAPAPLAEKLVEQTDLRATIVAADGTVLADTQNDAATMSNHADRPEVAAALAGRTGIATRVSPTEGIRELYVAVPARLAGSNAALRVSRPLAEVDAIATTSRRLGAAMLVLALVAAAAIATWASRAAAEPIATLSASAGRMAAGDLAVEVPAVPADLVPLAESLESLRRQMRSRLDALEGEQRTLRTALDGLADAVFLLEDDRVRYANDAAGRLFRTPAGGWRDTRIGEAGLPESLSSTIQAHLGEARPFAAELEPDPLGTTLRLSVLPLERAREGARALVVIADATERARLERVRRDFVANASHELKTPVAGIGLLAQSAGTAAADGDVDAALGFATQIESEAARLQRLVRDLLDLSRLETTPSPGAVTDMRAVIAAALAGHRSAAGRKGLVLETDFSAVSGIDVFAAADPTDVAVALDNLLDNAVTYTERGRVSITVEVSDASVRVRVADTGPGIPAEHLPRIFERFYRVDQARSREIGGTGLGLALVRHVVERSGGSVRVSSEVGAGTTFTLTLPRAT